MPAPYPQKFRDDFIRVARGPKDSTKWCALAQLTQWALVWVCEEGEGVQFKSGNQSV